MMRITPNAMWLFISGRRKNIGLHVSNVKTNVFQCNHVKSKHDNWQTSNICDKCENVNQNLCKDHIETNHELRILDCNICEHQRTKKSSLVEYVKIDHGGNFKYDHRVLWCNDCGEDFKFIASIRHHKHNIHVQCILQCKKCEERLQTENPIREHV